jgi:hypothetical protein
METKTHFSHDALDALVANIFGWFGSRRKTRPDDTGDIAFSDDWERKQIARELHWN